jgi:hypothetical protein
MGFAGAANAWAVLPSKKTVKNPLNTRIGLPQDGRRGHVPPVNSAVIAAASLWRKVGLPRIDAKGSFRHA